MAAYVDKPNWEWRGKMWCHLLADSLTELHDFADKLGLKREWFQDKARYPHYDITENMRLKALRIGALEADREKIVQTALLIQAEYKQLNNKKVCGDLYGNDSQGLSVSNM